MTESRTTRDMAPRIENRLEISAVYYALFQNGYDFYAMDKEAELIRTLETFRRKEAPDHSFWTQARQPVEPYPYWPRAALLEQAALSLKVEGNRCRFSDFARYRQQVLAAGNLTDEERNAAFWDWIERFPSALDAVLTQEDFRKYREWESQWIHRQSLRYQKELALLQKIRDTLAAGGCSAGPPAISVILHPIKCAFSADYHEKERRLLVVTGKFRIESIIHEALHPVVHPLIEKWEEGTDSLPCRLPGVDPSYTLDGSRRGMANALEEYLVIRLTEEALAGRFPSDLPAYIERTLRALS